MTNKPLSEKQRVLVFKEWHYKEEDLKATLKAFKEELLEEIDDCVSDWSYIVKKYNDCFKKHFGTLAEGDEE